MPEVPGNTLAMEFETDGHGDGEEVRENGWLEDDEIEDW